MLQDYPGVRIVNFDPAVFTVEGFMTPEECVSWQQHALESGGPGSGLPALLLVAQTCCGKTCKPSSTPAATTQELIESSTWRLC